VANVYDFIWTGHRKGEPVSGRRVGCQRVSSLERNPQRQFDGVVLVRTCPERLLGTDVDRPQLTEVLRFVRAGDMVTVHSRADGRRRTTGLVLVRHHSVDAGVDGGGRGPWVSEKQAGTAHAAVLRRESGDSRGVGFGVEGVSRRSRRLLVSCSRVDGLHRTGCGGG